MTKKYIHLPEHSIFLDRATAKLSSIYAKEEIITEMLERTRNVTKDNGKKTLFVLTSCFGVTKKIKTYFFNWKDKNFDGSCSDRDHEKLKKAWNAIAAELEKEEESSEPSSAIGQFACILDGALTSNKEIPKEYFPAREHRYGQKTVVAALPKKLTKKDLLNGRKLIAKLTKKKK